MIFGLNRKSNAKERNRFFYIISVPGEHTRGITSDFFLVHLFCLLAWKVFFSFVYCTRQYRNAGEKKKKAQTIP